LPEDKDDRRDECSAALLLIYLHGNGTGSNTASPISAKFTTQKSQSNFRHPAVYHLIMRPSLGGCI